MGGGGAAADSIVSTGAKVHNDPPPATREFAEDYPEGTLYDAPGTPLRLTIDGESFDPNARWVVGRQVVEGSIWRSHVATLTLSQRQELAEVLRGSRKAARGLDGWSRVHSAPRISTS